jgi:hypothetical protein
MRLMERWLGQMKEKGFDLKAYQESVVPRDAGLRETAPQPEQVTRLNRFLPGLNRLLCRRRPRQKRASTHLLNPQNGRACPVSQYHNKLTR